MKIKAMMSLPVMGFKIVFRDRNVGLLLADAEVFIWLQALILEEDRGLKVEPPDNPNGGGAIRWDVSGCLEGIIAAVYSRIGEISVYKMCSCPIK